MKERDEGLLNAKEAARYLRISPATLGRIEKGGYLSPYRTLGGHCRYGIEMLEEYLENSRNHTYPRRTQAEGPGMRKPKGAT